MFDDLDQLEAELDKTNAALESMIAEMEMDPAYETFSNDSFDYDDIATEGLFSKPKSLDKLLSAVQKSVDKKCKTVEDCQDMLAKITAEESKFNTAIQGLQDAARQYGEDHDKKALRNATGPILSELKKTCDILKMKDIAKDAKKELTDEELQKLRDFIIGAREIVQNKLDSLSGGGDETMESFMDYMEMDYDDYAEENYTMTDFVDFALEGVIDPDTKRNLQMRFSEVSRELKQTMRSAAAAKKAGNFDEAISLYSKAKKGFQGLLATAKKMGNRTDARGKQYASAGKQSAVNWCMKKMSECDGKIEAIKNQMVKGPRKAAEKEASAAKRAQRKEDRAARRAARKNKGGDGEAAAESAIDMLDYTLLAMEAYDDYDSDDFDDYDEDDYGMESYDEYDDDFDDDLAMEETFDKETIKGNGQKIRRLLKNMLNGLRKFCHNMMQKCKTDKRYAFDKKIQDYARDDNGDLKARGMFKFWKGHYDRVTSLIKRLDKSISESELKKIQKEAEKEKAEIKNSGSKSTDAYIEIADKYSTAIESMFLDMGWVPATEADFAY